MNKWNGFTLIELLVVVAIIGILAAVGTVAYTGYTSSAKLRVASANLKQISSWLSGEAYKVCQSKQGRNKNGMYLNNESNVPNYFVRCTDEGTDLAMSVSHYFFNNPIFKNPYTGENAIPSYAKSASFGITRNGLKTWNNRRLAKGEIMFLSLGGEAMLVIYSNIGDKNGNDKAEWMIIAAPSNY